MAEVGFSTGVFYRTNIPLEKKIAYCHSLSPEAIEIHFSNSAELFGFKPIEKNIDLEIFNKLYIHAPSSDIDYNSSVLTYKVLNKLKSICDDVEVHGIVLHPKKKMNFDLLQESGLPILIENLDKRNNVGTTLEYFSELKNNYNFGFVLDLQHVYGHDSEMNLAKEFLDAMGNKLNHFHVSGQTESEIHYPVHISDNRKSIEKILKLGINVPKILEGVLDRKAEILRNEFNHVKSFEL